jgi:hypothetical protein
MRQIFFSIVLTAGAVWCYNKGDNKTFSATGGSSQGTAVKRKGEFAGRLGAIACIAVRAFLYSKKPAKRKFAACRKFSRA